MERKHYYTGLMLKDLAGEISLAESQALQAWLDENEDHRQLFQSIQENWKSEAAGTHKSEMAYQQLAHRLGLEGERVDTYQQTTSQKTRKLNPQWLKIAASFTGLLMLAAVAYYFFFRTETIFYQTDFGETIAVLLPDSSTVTLNANSSLKYTNNWQKQASREVWLDGEAFFHVREMEPNNALKLPSKFIVHTSQVDVEVLGTAFNVNERRGKTTVVLNSGKVKLNSNLNQNEEVVMEPGEYVELSDTHQQFVRKVVDPEIYSSWTEKKLLMDNTTLYEIAQIIEDYYGLEVVFEDTVVAEKALTGSIPIDDLDTFLMVLSASIDIALKKEGNTLILGNKESP